MKWKTVIADYFSFTRRERIGLLLVICLIATVFLLPTVVSKNSSSGGTPDTVWIAALKKLEIKEAENKVQHSFDSREANNDYSYQYDRTVNNNRSPGILFYFDPNTLDKQGWLKLGLKDKTIHTIQNFLNKGGHFYKPEDLKKIYGLYSNDYLRLEPYIKIESEPGKNKPAEFARKEYEPKRFSLQPFDINTADTSVFIALPGIGSKLAARIVNFRDKLGGFYSVNQVGEVYGLADSTFQKIKPYLQLENISVKKININTATVDELKAHPYIKYAIANALVAFRNEHGLFVRTEDLKKMLIITDEVYNKLIPYLTTNK